MSVSYAAFLTNLSKKELYKNLYTESLNNIAEGGVFSHKSGWILSGYLLEIKFLIVC